MTAMKKGIQQEAAEALLDVGVSVPFVSLRLPLLKRPLLTLRLVMKRPTLQSLLRISRLYLKLGCTYKEMKRFDTHRQFEFLAAHGPKVAKMVALTVLRGTVSGYLLADLLKWLILWFMPYRYFWEANLRFMELLGTKPFMIIIRSVEIANPLKPRLSQKERKGS